MKAQAVIEKNPNLNHQIVADTENVLNSIIVVFSIMSGIGLIATLFLYQRKTASLAIILAVLATIIVVKLLIRSGHVRLSGIFIVSSLWIIFALLVLLGGGLNNINVVFFISLTVVAGLLLGKRATFLTAGAGIAVSIGVVLLTIFGYLPSPYFMSTPLGNLMQFGFALALTVSALNIALRDRDKALAESNQRLLNQLAAEQALKESEERFRELSIVDDLTRLYNSRHFYAQLNNELERSKRYEQPLTLLMLDLDDFKLFNDTYGHIEGDAVLSRLGQVIKRCLRETDIAFRYGGEEFTILLPMTTGAEGIVIAERIRQEFKRERFSPKPDSEVHLTVSIGIGQYEFGEDMRAFVHRVDLLMYHGKKNGKDRVCAEASREFLLKQ